MLDDGPCGYDAVVDQAWNFGGSARSAETSNIMFAAATMDLSSILIRKPDDHGESLVRAVQVVGRAAKVELDYDDLSAALGLSFLVCAPRGEVCPQDWSDYAQDWNLIEAARLFGLELRPLHPPEAADGLERAAEFGLHFEDSYAPLIRMALEHNQPVLAWQGWSGPRNMQWGVITGTGGDGVGFRGTTVGGTGQTVALRAPAVQCYVVEFGVGRTPIEPELMRFAVRAARRVVRNEIPATFGVTTGAAAYDAWLDWLKRKPTAAETAAARAAAHAGLACRIAAARQSAIAFLTRYREAAPPASQPAVDATIQQCSAVVDLLRSAGDPAAAAREPADASDVAQAEAAVTAARRYEQAVAGAVEALASRLE